MICPSWNKPRSLPGVSCLAVLTRTIWLLSQCRGTLESFKVGPCIAELRKATILVLLRKRPLLPGSVTSCDQCLPPSGLLRNQHHNLFWWRSPVKPPSSCLVVLGIFKGNLTIYSTIEWFLVREQRRLRIGTRQHLK